MSEMIRQLSSNKPSLMDEAQSMVDEKNSKMATPWNMTYCPYSKTWMHPSKTGRGNMCYGPNNATQNGKLPSYMGPLEGLQDDM